MPTASNKPTTDGKIKVTATKIKALVNQETTDPSLGLLEAFDLFKKYLADHKVYLVKHIFGEWCGFRVYVEDALHIPGIILNSTPIYRELKHNNLDDYQYFKTLVLGFTNNVENIFSTSFFLKRNVSNPVRDLSNSYPYEELLTSAKKALAHKIIPHKEWFKDHPISGYQISDLLPLFNPPELDTFVIHLGRVLAGSTGSLIDDVTIKHTYRTAPIIISPIPGIGKSLLMETIAEALQLLGFTTYALNPDNDSEFGLVKPANADSVVCDDINTKNFISFVKGKKSKFKIMISNGYTSLPVKSQEDWSGKTRPGILIMINEFNYSLINGVDSGILNRFHFLRITQKPFKPINILWDEISAKLGIPKITIAVYLLSLCYERFLKACSIGLDIVARHNQKGYLIQASNLDICHNLVKTVTEAIYFSIMNFSYNDDEREHLLKCFINSIITAPILTVTLALIKRYSSDIHYESTSQRLGGAIALFPKVLLKPQFIPSEYRPGDLGLSGRGLLLNSSNEGEIKNILSMINTITGNLFDYRLTSYQTHWLSQTRQLVESETPPKDIYGLSRQNGRSILITLMSSNNSDRVTTYYKVD